MANFGGPDAASAGLVIRAIEGRKDREMQKQQFISDSIFKAVGAYHNYEKLDLAKKDQALGAYHNYEKLDLAKKDQALDKEKLKWSQDPENPTFAKNKALAGMYSDPAYVQAKIAEIKASAEMYRNKAILYATGKVLDAEANGDVSTDGEGVLIPVGPGGETLWRGTSNTSSRQPAADGPKTPDTDNPLFDWEK